MDNTNQISEHETGDYHIIVEPQGISVGLAVPIMLILILMSAVAGYQTGTQHTPIDQQCKLTNQNTADQIAYQREQIKAQVGLQHEIENLCIGKGMVPAIVNGNISCMAVK
jgi:hypothetical protein